MKTTEQMVGEIAGATFEKREEVAAVLPELETTLCDREIIRKIIAEASPEMVEKIAEILDVSPGTVKGYVENPGKISAQKVKMLVKTAKNWPQPMK